MGSGSGTIPGQLRLSIPWRHMLILYLLIVQLLLVRLLLLLLLLLNPPVCTIASQASFLEGYFLQGQSYTLCNVKLRYIISIASGYLAAGTFLEDGIHSRAG